MSFAIVIEIGVTLAYQLGTWLYIRSKGRLFQFVIVSQLIALGYQGIIGTRQVITTSSYANAVDSRMHFISTLSNGNGIIELQPLPDSGWLFSSEITSDTSHFTNRHLGLFFGNQHQFVIKERLPSSE